MLYPERGCYSSTVPDPRLRIFSARENTEAPEGWTSNVETRNRPAQPFTPPKMGFCPCRSMHDQRDSADVPLRSSSRYFLALLIRNKSGLIKAWTYGRFASLQYFLPFNQIPTWLYESIGISQAIARDRAQSKLMNQSVLRSL